MDTDAKASETALITASLRALSNYESNETIRGHDPFAEMFLPDDRKAALGSETTRAMIKAMIPKGMYAYVIARTRYFDRLFVESLNDQMGQIVLLGAGYDSRPYRFRDRIKTTRIYEMDTHATQERKISILQTHHVDIHENIRFIPVDFEVDNFLHLLLENNFDPSSPTLFIWEGVTFYLTQLAVTKTLKLIRNNLASGSKIGFDFQTLASPSHLINTGLKDEAVIFGIESGGIDRFVKENGFEIVEHVTADAMEKRFLTLENGDLLDSIMPMMNFLVIEKR